MMWQRVAPKFSQKYGIQFNPTPQPSDWDAIEQIVRATDGGGQQTPPAKVQEAQWFAKERGLKPGTPEYTKFIAGYSGAGGGPGIKIHPQTGVMYQESPNGISVYDWGTKSWNMIDAPEQPDEEVRFADMPPEEQEAVTRVSNGLNSHVGIVGGKVVPMDGRTPTPAQQAATNVPQAPTPPPATGGQGVNPFAKPEAAPSPATWNAPVVETRGGKQVRVRYGTYNGQPIEQVMGEAEITPEAPKPATADERSAKGYLDRMVASEAELDKLVSEGFTPNAKDFYTAGEGAALNWMSSPKGQVWRQQQEDWVRAKLRRESGAAIPPEEMDREIKTYFPQPGDSKDVIEAKKRSRSMARQQFVTMAGSAAPSAPNKPAGGAKYKVGQVIQHNGKRYQVIGGDMNDPDLKEIP
jgi:hypothetical protein